MIKEARVYEEKGSISNAIRKLQLAARATMVRSKIPSIQSLGLYWIELARLEEVSLSLLSSFNSFSFRYSARRKSLPLWLH